jgi:hypothetical protein
MADDKSKTESPDEPKTRRIFAKGMAIAVAAYLVKKLMKAKLATILKSLSTTFTSIRQDLRLRGSSA